MSFTAKANFIVICLEYIPYWIWNNIIGLLSKVHPVLLLLLCNLLHRIALIFTLIQTSVLTLAVVFAGKERGRPIISLLSSPRETRAGMKDHSPMPSPETMSMMEDMARKLLNEDEVAAVMRHCKRVSQWKLIYDFRKITLTFLYILWDWIVWIRVLVYMKR